MPIKVIYELIELNLFTIYHLVDFATKFGIHHPKVKTNFNMEQLVFDIVLLLTVLTF